MALMLWLDGMMMMMMMRLGECSSVMLFEVAVQASFIRSVPRTG
jgi:hypothetical protein